MRDVQADYSLYSKVENIAGWLKKPAAFRTMDILAWQQKNQIEGGLLEIGVFCGKYFSLLLNSARAMRSPLLGIDTFQYAPTSRVLSEMAKLFGKESANQFILWNKDSTAVRAGEIETAIGRCRFISIDGAHDYESVFRDLVLAEQVVSFDGIIAADDFLNPLALGVNQALNAFLTQPRNIVPVAHIANKLFLAHRSRAAEYRSAIEEMCANGNEPASEDFRKRRGIGRHHIEQDFYGHKVILG